ncbi:MAG: HEAT repeat domain-containing protein [Planctomycetota bacterium]|nr:HEAT repeat domain-containing protein [Planctomycetota bacterium]
MGWKNAIGLAGPVLAAALAAMPQHRANADTPNPPPAGRPEPAPQGFSQAAQERITQLIRETCKPPAATRPAAGEPARWSEPVEGLQARVVYIGMASFEGCAVLVGLKNVSKTPLTVPMDGLGRPAAAGLFELQARSGAGPWKPVPPIKGFDTWENADSDHGGPNPGPAMTLPAGQDALVYLIGLEDPLSKTVTAVRVVLRRPAAGAPKDGWPGVLETPPIPAHWTHDEIGNLAGKAPFPAVFPAFDRRGSVAPNGPGWESQVSKLETSNSDLLWALRLFESAGIRQEFERRLAAEKDPPMKLLLACVAAGEGSQPAAMYLLEAMKKTDYAAVANLHDALKRLFYYYDREQPEWLVAMTVAAISDTRPVTGLEEAHFSADTRMTISEKARHLVHCLGYAKCRQTVPFLLEMVRKSPDGDPIMALGSMGDPRAVPVLIEVLKAGGKEARFEEGQVQPKSVEWSAAALGELKAAQAVPTLLEHLWCPEAVEALEAIGDRRALPALRELVRAEGQITRDGKPVFPGPELVARRLACARLALACLEEGDPLPRLCALLRDRPAGLHRCDVLHRLRHHPDPRAIPFLIEAIKADPDPYVVYEAICSLSDFKCKAAVQGLVDCFDVDFAKKERFGKDSSDPAEKFQQRIAESLRTITGRDLSPDKGPWVHWWQTEGRSATDLK